MSDRETSYREARTHALERTIMFTDAAVAIALTLLVLPLVDLVPDIGDSTLGTVLADHWQDLFSFALSFVVIANLWTVHRDIYQMIHDYDGPLVQLNFMWLLTVVFLPFPTALLATDGELTRGGAVLYLSTLLVNTSCALAQTLRIRAHPHLWLPHVTPTHIRGMVIGGVTVCIVEAVAVGVAFLSPHWGLSTLLLLFVTGRIQGARDQ